MNISIFQSSLSVYVSVFPIWNEVPDEEMKYNDQKLGNTRKTKLLMNGEYTLWWASLCDHFEDCVLLPIKLMYNLGYF